MNPSWTDNKNILDENMEELKNQVQTLKDSLALKDDQIQTLKDSLSLKNEQIQTLDESLKIKNEKMEALEKSIQLKEEKLQSANSTAGESEGGNERVQELEKQVEILNQELQAMDETIERLEIENEELKSSSATSSDSQIKDYTDVNIPKQEIVEKMRDTLNNALHTATIALPSIEDLQDLYLYEVRSSVNLKISCYINPGNELHADLLEQYESLDNISIRSYEDQDRYLIVRDGEELLIGVIGNKETNHLVFHTRDEKHIKFFNSLAMETWLHSRRI